MTQYGNYFDPDGVRDLAFSILRAEGRKPNGKRWSIRDLCILFDWMSENISYEYDKDLYDQSHYVATPRQTLDQKRGDCEDHALLYGSLCLAIGAKARMALVLNRAHAFSEICLGKSSNLDMKELQREIRRYLDDKSDALGVKRGRYLVENGKVAKGWKKDSDGQWVKTGRSWSYWPRNMTSIQWIRTDGGHIYLPTDTLFMRYPGDVKTMKEWRSKSRSKMWREVSYFYPPTERTSSSRPTPIPRRSRENIPRPPRPRMHKSGPSLSTLLWPLVLCGAIAWGTESLHWGVDIGALILTWWFGLRGLRSGFVDQAGRIAAWVLPAVATLLLLAPVGTWVADYLPLSESHRTLLLAAALFLVTRLICRRLLGSLTDGVSNGALDSVAGLALGAVKGLIATCLLLQGLQWGLKDTSWHLPANAHAVQWMHDQPWLDWWN